MYRSVDGIGASGYASGKHALRGALRSCERACGEVLQVSIRQVALYRASCIPRLNLRWELATRTAQRGVVVPPIHGLRSETADIDLRQVYPRIGAHRTIHGYRPAAR